MRPFWFGAGSFAVFAKSVKLPLLRKVLIMKHLIAALVLVTGLPTLAKAEQSSKLRIVCYAVSDKEVGYFTNQIQGVILAEQMDNQVYSGSEMHYDALDDVFTTDYVVPFNVTWFPNESFPASAFPLDNGDEDKSVWLEISEYTPKQTLSLITYTDSLAARALQGEGDTMVAIGRRSAYNYNLISPNDVDGDTGYADPVLRFRARDPADSIHMSERYAFFRVYCFQPLVVYGD